MFAGAPRDGFGFFDFGFQRAHAGAFVRTIAEWLALRTSARAPPIGAGFDFLDDGTFLEDGWFVHNLIPLRLRTAGLRLV